MNRNTEGYMVDKLKTQLARQKAENDAVISQKDSELFQKDAEIQRLREKLAPREITDNFHYISGIA